ncbi:MAG: SMI1/KNR4 family protein [Lachnospiraceae bacterium]|nr:SMI1/KNR4 family protein [Lachnospiraceae bacterium]
MVNLYKKILKKPLPIILSAILAFFLGAMFRIVTNSGLLHVLGFLLIAIAVLVLMVIGNPISKFEQQLKELGYTWEILQTDLEKGISYGNIDLGNQFLVSYGLFTKVIFFGDMLWTYLDEEPCIHMIMKDNTEHLIPVENLQIGQAIAKQMEKAFPFILFGYHEEIANLREENFEDLKQLYTRKMFECVVKEELPAYAPYPSTRPKQEAPKPEPEPQAPPYPSLPEIDLDTVKVPDNSLSEYFTELVALCKAYPEDMNVTFHAPAKPKAIAAFEKKHNLTLPAELKDLLLFSNGFSLDFDDFYCLEEIEYHLTNWGPLEEDGEEYIFIASVVGDGEEIVFSKKTGLIYWHDHGDFREYGTLDAVLEERLEYQKDNLGVE